MAIHEHIDKPHDELTFLCSAYQALERLMTTDSAEWVLLSQLNRQFEAELIRLNHKGLLT